ncbi:MAG: hypothetical protein ABEI80_02355 [Haloplanus sp.]
MPSDDATPAAVRFDSLGEGEQEDLKHEAWTDTVEAFAEERPDQYELLDDVDAWDDIMLDVTEDEHGRKRFEADTDILPPSDADPSERHHEAAAAFLDAYRDRLRALLRERGPS